MSAQPALAQPVEEEQEETRQRESAQSESPSTSASSALATVNEDAKLCDDAIGSLQKARSKAEARNRSKFAETTISDRIASLMQGTLALIRTTVMFTLSIPGRVTRFMALPKEERRAIYKGWWQATKKEAKHYWSGSKLLVAEVKIAMRLINKALHGHTLTRRERRQLTRTTADVFRMVPMLVFLAIPFMEFLLPVALRLFPNMLPSTFEDKLKKEEELKKRVGVKLEVARFLQDTVSEMAKQMKSSKTGETQASAAELYAFMKRVRAGEPVSQYDIVKFAQLFNDELTLDNLERIHLVNLCRFVGIQPFGTDAFLVARLRAHLEQIKRDDRMIKSEGLEALSEDELRQACRVRGMRAPFGEGAVSFMRKQLKEWLDLSLNRALPSSLLLLSRAFTVTQPLESPREDAPYESLKETISSLPNKVIAEVTLDRDGDDDYARKLDQLRREEELIVEENKEAAALLQADIPIIQPGQNAQEELSAAAAAAVVREAAASAVMDVLEGESAEEKACKLAAAKEERMRKVISALAMLASSSGVSSERSAFMDLVRNEIDRLNGEISARGALTLMFQRGNIKVEKPAVVKEVIGQKRLADKVTGILERIEKELDTVDTKIGEAMHILDTDNDGMVTQEELQTAMGFLKEQLGEDELRALLDRLNDWQQDGATPIDVAKLMQMAASAEPLAPSVKP
ncbi:g3807 [Coccomyxa elongata]